MFPWRLKNGSLAQNKMFRPHEPNPDGVPSAHSFARGESVFTEVEGDVGEPREDRRLLHRKQPNIWARFLIRVMADLISS